MSGSRECWKDSIDGLNFPLYFGHGAAFERWSLQLVYGHDHFLVMNLIFLCILDMEYWHHSDGVGEGAEMALRSCDLLHSAQVAFAFLSIYNKTF